jgi:capsid portal protein
VENTNAKGKQKTTGEDFDRHYTSYFQPPIFNIKPMIKITSGQTLAEELVVLIIKA